MNTKTRIALVAATLGMAAVGHAENGVELVQGIFAQTNHTLIPLLEWRARYEYGEQDNSDPSHAATLRARVGLQSQDYNGFSGLLEFEATRALDTDTYIGAGKTPIADPETTEINRAQIQFKRGDHLAIGGRQRIILDNARFVGNVGWRQNEQTFDALSYKNTSIENMSLYYAYLDSVNRIFGSEATGANKRFNSDSHLLNASYSGIEGLKLTGYAYLLDFDNSAANSSDTVGISAAYKSKIAEDYAFDGYAEFAYQQDGGDNPVDYSAPYLHVNGKVAREGYSGLLGLELLGSDDENFGFRTPLATAHAFNGWNDQFLVTPNSGLKDIYAGIGLPCIPKVPMTFVYHYFTAANGSSIYGHEFDFMASYKVSPKMKAIAKASYYDADEFSVDRTRFSVEMNYKY